MIAIRASSLGRRCGVFGALSESLPRDAGQTEAMARGTQIHADVEAAIKARPKDPLHEVIRSLGHTAAADAMLARMVADAVGPLIASTRAEVSLAQVVHGAVLHGTIDAVKADGYDDRTCAVVVDWKTGHCGGLPLIDADLQMRAYAHLSGVAEDVGVYVMRVQIDTGLVDVLDLRSDSAWGSNRSTVEAAVAWHIENHGQPAGGATCATCPIRAYCLHY